MGSGHNLWCNATNPCYLSINNKSINSQTNHSDNFVESLMMFVEVIYAFGGLFMACGMGQRLSLAFEECSEMVYQFEWYLFSGGIQRMMPMILNFTQQPFEITCFGSKACDRDTFKSVSVKNAFFAK